MKKQFKTESKKMLDMMINSVYTHREIFLRELISNASDAIDKRVFRALTDSTLGLDRSAYAIELVRDKAAGTLTVRDNGCGMTKEDLENNLGTIAKSGSGEFKKENESDTIDIIGQFGVGFYSAFMVADKITVRSRAIGSDTAYEWVSEGADGYTVDECDKADIGSEVILHLRADTENDKYSEYLDQYTIENLVRKYSDYIRYPIKTEVEKTRRKEGCDEKKPEYEKYTEIETLNSMVPLWHKPSADVKKEEYDEYYKSHFYDYADPLATIHGKTEGVVSYEMLLFIPSKAPFDYYSKNYEKGLQLYTSGVMITEKCADLLPDYFNFVRGVVDSSDLTLNISRETLQQNHQVQMIAKNLEKKIRTELTKMCEEKREDYEKFFSQFGTQLKYGAYADYGAHKENLQDLLLFKSSLDKKYVTLKEYVSRMPEAQKDIYYACGETAEQADALPRTGAVKAKGYEVLLLSEDIDEFVLRVLEKYSDKAFVNVSTDSLDLSTEDEKNAVKKENEDAKELLDFMKESLGDEVSAVRFSSEIGEHPVNLSSEGYMSAEMAKVLNRMPGAEQQAKAQMVLEISKDHPVAAKLKDLYATDRDKVATYAKILYGQARLISGLDVKDPTALTDLICGLL